MAGVRVRDAEWAVAVDHFADWLVVAGKPATTVRLYRHYVDSLSERYPAGPWNLDLDDLVTFLAASESWGQDTRKSARTALRSFYLWAWTAGRVDENPARHLPAVTVPRRRARPAPSTVVADALDRAARRERSMILLGRYEGLRCCEIAKVHTDDVEDQELHVIGKGGKHRTIPVHPLVAADLATYEAGYLFPGQIDGHVSPAHVSVLLSRALPGRHTGHTLRHTFATAMVDAGVSPELVQELLGHESITTTMTYVRTNRSKLRYAVLAGGAEPDPVLAA